MHEPHVGKMLPRNIYTSEKKRNVGKKERKEKEDDQKSEMYIWVNYGPMNAKTFNRAQAGIDSPAQIIAQHAKEQKRITVYCKTL